MSQDAGDHPAALADSAVLAATQAPGTPISASHRSPMFSSSSRMQYRSRPVSVAVDSVSLVISECIAITSAIQKHARSPHSSVSAILGGSPNLIQLVPPSGSALRRDQKTLAGSPAVDGASDLAASRWGLRGKKGKSILDNPLISGFGRLRHELTGVKGSYTDSNGYSDRRVMSMERQKRF